MEAIELKRVNGEYGFEAKDAQGNIARLDNSLDSGGQNFGVRPMLSLLIALGACSGIDVISILKKQRQDLQGYSMKIEGEREKQQDFSLWKTVHVTFNLSGNIDPDKATRACELSVEKYCSVAETLRRAGCTITWEVNVS
ncbi:OsmC family protein [Pontibacter cellulosilyticus]|uniref:OsmC family protein n=1 Tax=Pontibacter cellulosilyticus TaxID=1720253 RepID=A0A923NC20_9BACT|nr:OsmC family protein [Pontibacter cellulosilyticus]MBC5994652.1 OsmC family protein [Pontibacter cellulosilyticus]